LTNADRREVLPGGVAGNFGRCLRMVRGDTRRTEFQQQLVCDPLLAPGAVLVCQLANQLLEVARDRLAARLGLPTPEKAEALAVPGDEGWVSRMIFRELCRSNFGAILISL